MVILQQTMTDNVVGIVNTRVERILQDLNC